ncbi:MAG: acyl-phosphate glycerol 3-phosphate acyltransferase [Lentisphaerae bacterium GWF2_52_8]|nr:MAG: acyl-phosphate glycerol 3-phosphate acyltransferase [Lentisphaerae bacterium GWF2_52_8]
MHDALIYALLGGVTYLFASIPWGYLIGRCKGVDIRKEGSGNIGATNVRRVLGKPMGILCFSLDFVKGFLPVFATAALAKKGFFPENNFDIPTVLAAFAAMAGHLWPVYLGFKGGKGISTAAGILLALAPLALFASGAIWALVFYSSRYVSLASICASLALPLCAWGFSSTGCCELSKPLLILLFAIALLSVAKHSSNIKRLLNGTENRFSKPGQANTEKDSADNAGNK